MADGEVIGPDWLPSDAGIPLAPREPAAPAPVAAAGQPPSVTLPLGTSLAEAERQLIVATFEFYGRSKERASAALGISIKTLYNRLKLYSRGDDDREEPGPDAADPVRGA